jgi:hypothetical protein
MRIQMLRACTSQSLFKRNASIGAAKGRAYGA